jgi:starch-binding outer membrane protein, SusD/RagB family
MNKYKILILCAFVLGLTACEQVLVQEPQSQVSTDIKDAATARAVMNGAYNGFQSADYFGTRYQLLPDLQGGNLRWTGTFSDFSEISNRSIQTSNASVTNMWVRIYNTILRTNIIIKAIPLVQDATFTDAEKNQIVAEAKVMRAVSYFNLVRWWGGVPIVTEPTASIEGLNVPRNTVAEVYKQISTDIDAALPNLLATNKGRITKGTALALKCRAALYQKDYATVISVANQIQALNQYALVTPFQSIFSTQNTKESIWEINYETTNSNSLAFFLFSSSLGGRNEVRPTPTLTAAYSLIDTRRILTTSYDVQLKYYRINGTDFPIVFRFAEVLLNKAEALSETGKDAEALVLVNQIRTRAGLAAAAATLAGQDLKDEIFLQRRLELALEGHYFFDLVRTGRAAKALTTWNDNQALLPIPDREIKANPVIATQQNPGY